jgi:hypothetical protein
MVREIACQAQSAKVNSQSVPIGTIQASGPKIENPNPDRMVDIAMHCNALQCERPSNK